MKTFSHIFLHNHRECISIVDNYVFLKPRSCNLVSLTIALHPNFTILKGCSRMSMSKAWCKIIHLWNLFKYMNFAAMKQYICFLFTFSPKIKASLDVIKAFQKSYIII